MSVCKSIKVFTRKHEWLADLFALLAVLILFGSLYLGLAYHSSIMNWLSQNLFVHAPVVLGTILLELAVIFFLLNISSVTYTEEDDEGCFHTFRGRRAGTGSVKMAFNGLLHHIEFVGKKHR
ncbi:MAG: cell division protein BolA [Pseudomonadota bacterium]